ncbi:hypothetical protein C7M84_006195 [Penaeus vannamei]|uniref:DUF885 domain-containing protein n=1 Tax=Penaeus vannamei TaxID=6689 RepID=A0A423TFI1_PENVA|nr:hypothetical protein C7M84_006195 [Penaeus vannamei]
MARLALLLLSCALLMGSGSASRLAPALEELTTQYWEWRILDAPEYASFVGIHEHDHFLDDMSLEAYQRRLNQSLAFLGQAEALEDELTERVDLVNLKILKRELETYITGFPFKAETPATTSSLSLHKRHLLRVEQVLRRFTLICWKLYRDPDKLNFVLPLCYMEGIHTDFERLISWMVFETTEDFQKLLSRFENLPRQLQQIQQLMEEGVAAGIVNHAISMKGVAESLGRFVVSQAEDSPLWERFTSFPDSFTQEEITALQDQARQLILNEVSVKGYVLQEYVQSEYTTRPEIAVTSLPDGEERYAQLLSQSLFPQVHTSTSLTASEIHQLGLDEVARIEGEMAKIVEELGYDMTVPEFSAMIRNDSRFYYDNADDLLAGFQDLAYNVIPPKIPLLFTNIPTAELQVVADPSPDGVGAYYLAGAYDGSRPGIFYVNTYHYDAQPKYAMMTLSLHEGNPGHHLQGSHSIESTNMPFFRRAMEDRNYFQAPSRFPMNTAYTEGWGLYSESLGFDLELFGDPYDRYGHYSDEIFRACRLVVDTGMHDRALGWTRQEAIDFMFSHTAMSLVDVENEIDRYITWPGQAVSYKVGQLKISELKAKASSELGEAFDVKKFHDIVLESVGPLDVVEEEIDAWVAAGGGP